MLQTYRFNRFVYNEEIRLKFSFSHTLHRVVMIVLVCFSVCHTSVMAQDDVSSTGKVQQIFDDFLQYRHQNKINKALEVLSEAAKIAENNEDAKLLLDTYHQYAR